ncbi:ATPase family gene 2 protein homolog A [Stomoxys calcitrans]|uniref:ATPase family gene 2 protein homolog A n=1 Tax=Stomoxys calcitrans TaxID=35570 RepID=UPI0027E31BE1|nr:ATPase family gene 2 protein homolog A [Stomoxys calcitrans]
MPPKSSNKKSASKPTAIWYHCDVCETHITANDREGHERICPIGDHQSQTDKGESLEYIHCGTFYTSSLEVKKFEIEALKDMPSKYLNNLIFLSEGAMRLTGIHIGQEVMIKSTTEEEISLIRNVWPTPDKFLTTVFVNDEDYKQIWSSYAGHSWQIQALPKDQPIIAKTIVLQIIAKPGEMDDPLNDQQLKDLGRLLKLEYKNLCYTKGSHIRYDFFNKSLELKVIEATNMKDDAVYDLEKSIEKLTLNKNSNGDIFKIANCTQVDVVYENNEKQAENNEDAISVVKDDIGGLAKQLEIIEEAIDFALGLRDIPKGVKISRSLLVYGSSGCGKTIICEAMATKLLQKQYDTKSTFLPLILKLNSSELFSKFLGETEKNLNAQFDKVFHHYPQPSLVIIEDVHNLCPKHENNEVVKRVAIAFFSILDALAIKKEAQKCFVLATTSNVELLNPSLRRCGRLDCEVEVAPPSPEGRKEIFRCLLRKIENHRLTEEDIQEIAQITHGFVGADLANLVYNATLKAMKLGNSDVVQLNIGHVRDALLVVKPSAMREVLIECPNVRWTDIGGQDDLKLKLKQAIEWPLKHAEQFKRLGIKPPRGLLMYGPPGCSKTMIAKALATESQLNFLSIKGPELFSMWVGESERAVREVFRKARQVAPAIIFFDEIDAIGGERADGSSGASGSSVKERVLTQLLTEMDGVESLENVTIVAATNRPDMIDKALLRPGRIDRIVYVGLPDDEARQQIFQIKLQKMPLADDVNIQKLVDSTNGYSGAEIQAVCHEAALKTLEENFDASSVTMAQFEYALNIVQPRTSADLLRLYEEYMKKT